MAAATAFRRPLRGVLHAAMVLSDAALMTVADDQFDTVWRPKVVGARALHTAIDGHRPDWFVVFSSMASLIGNAGQTVYAAANSWLDGFAQWRAAQGLPTLAVNWGPWGETGAATDFAARGYTHDRHGRRVRGTVHIAGPRPGPDRGDPGTAGRAGCRLPGVAVLRRRADAGRRAGAAAAADRRPGAGGRPGRAGRDARGPGPARRRWSRTSAGTSRR